MTHNCSTFWPAGSYFGFRSAISMAKSPIIEPRFLPVVIMPQPPIEWNRTAIALSGSSEGVSFEITAYG